MQRVVGSEDFRPRSAQHELAIYVSSAGRVFNRLTNSTRSGTGKNEQVAGEEGARRVPSFEGRTLQVFMPFKNNAGLCRVSAAFAEDFGSCTASVSYPRDGSGATPIGRSSITGRMIEFKSIESSGVSCAVSAGNIVGE